MAKIRTPLLVKFKTPKSKTVILRNKKTGKTVKLRTRNFRKTRMLPKGVSRIAGASKAKRKRNPKTGRFA